MKKKETIEILKRLKGIYPNFCIKMTNAEKVRVAEEWVRAFKNIEIKDIAKSIDDYAKQNTYPPSISDIYLPALDCMRRRKLYEKAKCIKKTKIDINKISVWFEKIEYTIAEAEKLKTNNLKTNYQSEWYKIHKNIDDKFSDKLPRQFTTKNIDNFDKDTFAQNIFYSEGLFK